jgi:hypothetical protein
MTKNSQRFAACEPTLFQPMKQYRLPSLLLASATLAWAVPSEINYQGRLTDANGDPLTGEVSMSLKMFDAATAGNELYSEDIGTVTLDDNGVYSFPFGADGQSVVATSESITSTDGVNQVFNATLANLPVDGSVSVSDGTYTWSQANGSSSSTEFTASLTPSSGAISIIYLNGVPTSNVDITASYNYMDATVVGALSSHESHWLELSVDGSAQSPRERVLSIPFSLYSDKANLARKSQIPNYNVIIQPSINTSYGGDTTTGGDPSTSSYQASVFVPPDADQLMIKFAGVLGSQVWDGSRRSYKVDVVVTLGSTPIHQYSLTGTSYTGLDIGFTKTIDVATLEVPSGFTTFGVEITKSEYGDANNAVKINAGSFSFWLIGSPSE